MGLVLAAFDDHPEWEAVLCNMAHDEVNVECAWGHREAVGDAVLSILHECMRWGGIVDLPVDEPTAKGANMVVTSWADK